MTEFSSVCSGIFWNGIATFNTGKKHLVQLPVRRESIPRPFFDPYPQVPLVESCCASPPCWPTWVWGKTLRLSDPVSASPETSDSSAPTKNTKLRGHSREQHLRTRTYDKYGQIYSRSVQEGRSMTVHSQQCSSHSKRADGAGDPDPTKLNIYTLTHIRGAVQGAINISVLLHYTQIMLQMRATESR